MSRIGCVLAVLGVASSARGQVGACCLSNNNCLVLTETDCGLIKDSSWAGAGTDCRDVNGNGFADVCVEAEPKIYWIGAAGIWRANLDGTDQETVTVPNPEADIIAVDQVHAKLRPASHDGQQRRSAKSPGFRLVAVWFRTRPERFRFLCSPGGAVTSLAAVEFEWLSRCDTATQTQKLL